MITAKDLADAVRFCDMKIQLQCDVCGKLGGAEDISTDYDGRDLCAFHAKAAHLSDLKQEHASKKEWLESTHLKNLRDLEKQIADIERELSAESPSEQ